MASNASITAITRKAPATTLDVSGDEESYSPREVLRQIQAQDHSKHVSKALASGIHQDPHRPGHRQTPNCDCNCSEIAFDSPKPHLAAHPSENVLEAHLAARQLRPRRQAIDLDTFQPLDAVQEEDSRIDEIVDTRDRLPSSALTTYETNFRYLNPFKDIPSDHITEIKKHLKGEFEWLISYPPSTSSSSKTSGHNRCDPMSCEVSGRTYGCNLLGKKAQSGLSTDSSDYDSDHCFGERYILLATQLGANSEAESRMEPKIVEDDGFAAWEHSPNRLPVPLKVPDIIQAVENALLSPSLTFVSDRSCSYGNRSSRTGSFSLSRIEDSLEELDRLEDELEALVEVTKTRRMSPLDKATQKQREKSYSPATPRPTKRASVVCLSSTYLDQSPRAKTSSSLRRSTSLTLGSTKHGALSRSPDQGYHASRGDPDARSGRQRMTSKPSRARHFEPSDEVSPRPLRRQREACPTHQVDVQEAPTSPPKPGFHRLPAKPTFELPSEVISRPKREMREAKLRTQEAEERNQCETKARLMKNSTTPSTVPRDTIASRARQAKIQHERAEKQAAADASKAKRMINTSPRSKAGTAASSVGTTRGRSVDPIPMDRTSRATSASTMSSAKRQSALYTHHYPIERQDREQERRDRETMAKTAREVAAERSRIASREWAEKKRRKEAAVRRIMQ